MKSIKKPSPASAMASMTGRTGSGKQPARSPGSGHGVKSALVAAHPDSKASSRHSPVLAADAGSEGVSKAVLKQARLSGQLNLSDKGLSVVPDSIVQLNQTRESTPGRRGLTWNCVDEEEESDNWWQHVPLQKLLLASNQIIRLPDTLGVLDSLTVLDLHDNRIEALPAQMGLLRRLTKLDLSRNQISQLPEELFQLNCLQKLLLSHNRIRQLSAALGSLDELLELDLDHNELTELPSGLGYLTKLTRLKLDHNQIGEVPEEIGFLRNVRMLDLSHNQLVKAPDSLEDLSHVEVLCLHHNQLRAVPRLGHCLHLKELQLAFNRIEKITSDDLKQWAQLKVLDLKDNKIPDLPSDHVICLQSLERLDLSNNDLSGLPNSLAALPHLKSLIVSGNPFKTIRRDIIQRGTVQLLDYLRSRMSATEARKLRISTSVVAEVADVAIPDKYAMKTAQKMCLSKKQLQQLPEEAVRNAVEAGVQVVDLSQNQLSELPVQLEALMPNLCELDLSWNRIIKVSSLINAAAGRLQYLNLSHNQLKQLPDEISQLRMLREVDLSYNQLQLIPDCVFGCDHLEILNVSNNQVSRIEVDQLKKLTRLAVLLLENNNLEQVPPQLGLLTHIRHLQLEGNAFRVPRAQILSSGTEAIMAYLRDRISCE